MFLPTLYIQKDEGVMGITLPPSPDPGGLPPEPPTPWALVNEKGEGDV